MAIYTDTTGKSVITRVEFATAAGQQLVFLHPKDSAAAARLEAWITDPAFGLTLVSTTSNNGEALLVASGDQPPQATLTALANRGVTLAPYTPKERIDPWVIRSILGFGGQILQLASSFMRPTKKIDPNIFVFAAANLTANAINLVYKAQDAEDPNQLRHLKRQENKALEPVLATHKKHAPNIEETRKSSRESERQKQKNGPSLHDILKRYSVNIGELGLRYLGAFGLAFALDWKQLAQGKLPPLTASPLRRYAGLSSIAGKTVALGSKIEDPYDPKPPTWLDKFREKYTFLLGGLIEVTSFSALAYDNFMNTNPANPAQRNRGILWKGTVYRDWLGGIGASMFVMGYIVRSWAKYGQRHVDMDELRAHVSDTIAQLPPEQIPQHLALAAQRLAEHFKHQHGFTVASIYAGLADDLYTHHHIAVHPVHRHQQISSHEKASHGSRPQRQVFAPQHDGFALDSQKYLLITKV